MCKVSASLPVLALVLSLTFLGGSIASAAPLPCTAEQTAGSRSPAQPTTLTALHRSGQTFLTWPERTDLAGEHYRLYRHTEPITPANLAQATRLYEVAKGSGRFFANRYMDDGGQWQYRYLERFVIQDHGSPLAANVGLLVWTLAAADFGGGAGGSGYYAATVVPHGGAETWLSATTVALSESVADPLPVEAPAGAGGHVYIQYMDLRLWNATFHAPNRLNAYYGLDAEDPAVAGAVQYAYDYVVYEPRPSSCPGGVPTPAPVFINLHGWGGNYPPLRDYPDAAYCAYGVYPFDVLETWYFGFARQHDYRGEGEPGAGDTIANYTEQRLLRMLYDLVRNPPGPAVDRQRLFVYGQSMGGSGALALALRYPNVFAAAYASEPMTHYAASGDGGGTDWRGDVTPKWGNPTLNLPVQIGGPGDWAAHLARYNSTGVWDWQNHQANMRNRVGDEMAPLGVAHGRADTVIEWPTQGRPAYAAFNAGRRAWGGAITNADHTWLSFAGLPPNLALGPGWGPFADFNVVRNETVPGLSNGSADLPLPPDGEATGGYNQLLRWSASWDPWDGPPVDTADHWQMSLCAVSAADAACGTGAVQTVDVTPRRRQHFVVTPGVAYTWENHRVSDGSLVASGTVIADSAGLITVRGVAVSPGGNRLRLRPADGGTPLPGPSATLTAQHSPTPTWTHTHTPMAPARIMLLPLVLKGVTRPSPASPTPSRTSSPTPSPTPSVSPSPTATRSPVARRPWPSTQRGIHVFNDQLASQMSEALWHFAATHYDGTQKMARSDADSLRAINPNFLILHYRLGPGLGYRTVQGDCQPTGEWLLIIEGNEWAREWPSTVQERWLYHWPETSTTRVLNCDWGWYLAELNDPAWRAYWQGEVLRQLQANDDDGLFMDSLSVPNYLGADHYRPALPEVDESFESAWSARITAWLTWLQGQPVGDYYLVPNVGSWITSRDQTDYSPADGVMIEGFAIEADASPYSYTDWQLQMDRALSLIVQNKAILAQSYATGNQGRMFALGSYLLIKGVRTYLNIELDAPPEWWPEYDIPLGAPTESAGTDIGNLYDATHGVYRRDYDNGFVLANPTNPWDGTGVTRTVDLGGAYYLAETSGGGEVPDDGIPTGAVTYRAVTQVVLPPYSAAVLFNNRP